MGKTRFGDSTSYVTLLLAVFTMFPGASTIDRCRTREGTMLPPHIFELHTCATCYSFMFASSFNEKAQRARGLIDGMPIMHLKIANSTVVADVNDPELLATFSSDSAREKWITCCDNAKACCRDVLSANTSTPYGWCPRTWDGWLCWQDAPPRSSQLAACPAFIALGSQPPSCMMASKRCEDGGEWFRVTSRDQGNKVESSEWTNYSTCSLVPNLQKRAYVSIAAYTVSIVALIPALIIFSVYRQLRVARVALHRQLFGSLLLNAVAVIGFKSLVLLPVTEQNPLVTQASLVCKLLLLATKYLRLSNYMWMFCEGFYLHRLISAAFVEHNGLMLFYLIGWGFPIIPLIIYVVARMIEEGPSQCWAFAHGHSEWIFYVPCLLSLALNLVFLVDIIRVLWLKLRARHNDEPSQYRKTVRATLVLVPLFGLHLSLTMYRPSSGFCSGKFIQWYYIADYLLDGLQGCIVALTFCYCNGEVHYLLRRSYRRFMERHHPSLVFQSWASSAAAPGTTVSLADAPSRRPRALSNCCIVDADSEKQIKNNGETGI